MRHALAALLSLSVLGFLALALPAHAQSCTADSQCGTGGQNQATCLGDMLVVRRGVCMGSSCQMQEVSRTLCPSRGGSQITCQGNVAVSQGGGCDSLAGRCGSRVDRDVCVKSCACGKNRLIIATGQCMAGAGCVRTAIQCDKGCTCSGTPRCL